MTHEHQKLWLRVTALAVGSFAPIMFLASMENGTGLAARSVDVLFGAPMGHPVWEGETPRFLSALMGGFLAGWGVLIWLLSGRIHDAEPEAVRKAVLASVIAWFVVDSTGSVLSGGVFNVLPNLVLLGVIAWPLRRPASRPAGA